MLDVGTKILDQHVGALNGLEEDRAAFFMLQIDRDAAFVALEVLKVGPVAAAAQLRLAVRRFDLDDLCPPIRQLAHRRRTRTHTREIENLEAREGERLRHGYVPEKRGLRFSMKARRPSEKSALSMQSAESSASRFGST